MVKAKTLHSPESNDVWHLMLTARVGKEKQNKTWQSTFLMPLRVNNGNRVLIIIKIFYIII